MKRFLAFYGDNYYPSGGVYDLLGDFDTLMEAVAALEAKVRSEQSEPAMLALMGIPVPKPWQHHWAHVFDQEEAREVWAPPA